jgi:hypothetical protein
MLRNQFIYDTQHWSLCSLVVKKDFSGRGGGGGGWGGGRGGETIFEALPQILRSPHKSPFL